jgi:hypothetical protein
MRHVVRRRRPDGITELRPIDARLERPGWYLATFSVLFATCALFVSAQIPPSLFGAMIVAAIFGELCFGLRDLLDQRRPLAEVVVLAGTRFR